jgi:hypothetical protein
MKRTKVKVIFRISRNDSTDVYALFPEIPGTRDPSTCQCYQHDGQHSNADYAGCVRRSRPATPREYAALLAELRRIGYDVEIKQGDPSNIMRRARLAELERMNEAARTAAESEARASLPPCARDMGCLCAGHARGNAATDACDATE